MNSLRKLTGLLCASMLAAIALSSNAAFSSDKTFTLNMTVAQPALSPATVTATFTNQGNSSFNSLTLDAPGGLEITGTPTTSRGTATLTSTGAGNRVKVININLPTGTGQFVTVTLTVRRPATTCGVTTGTWIGVPWTGSSLTGNTFSIVTPPIPTTTIGVGCMGFSSQPNYAFTNTVITSQPYNNPPGSPVQISLTPPTPGIPVSLVSSCSGVTLSGATANSDANGLATFSSLKGTSTNGTNCMLIASASSFQSATSNGFNVGTPSLTFGTNTQPNTTLSGAVITSTKFNNPPGTFVTVNLLLDGQPTSAFDTTSVQIVGSPGSCIGSGNTMTPTNGVATFSHLTAGAIGSCALGATVPAYPPFGSSPLSNSFIVAPINGSLVCQGQDNPNAIPPLTSHFGSTDGAVNGNRGGINKDGTPCSPVVYAINSSVGAGTNEVSLKWDTVSQPNAAFRYTVLWNPIAVDPGTGLPPATRRTKVAWDVDANGNPIFVFGVACLSSNLPTAYTTLLTDAGGTLTVASTSGMPSTPFPIVIDNERMNVTAVAGNTLTVSRAQGGTTQTTHASDAPVMSTPLPIDPNPTKPDGSGNQYQGKQAHMCIEVEGFGAYSPGFVQFTTTAFDVGDGFMDLE